jgi:hypothetical protein
MLAWYVVDDLTNFGSAVADVTAIVWRMMHHVKLWYEHARVTLPGSLLHHRGASKQCLCECNPGAMC